MKKIKHKLFYIGSFLIYMFLALAAFVLSYVYLEPNMKAFFIKNFTALKVSSPKIIDVVVDDTSINKYPLPWPKYMYTEILDYFSTYAKPKAVGFDFINIDINPMSKADMDFLAKISKMDNFVTGFTYSTNMPAGSEVDYMNMIKKKFALNVDYRALDYPSDYHQINKFPKLYTDTVKNIACVNINAESPLDYKFSGINVIKIGDSYYPSLALKMYLIENNTNDIIIDDYNIIVPKTGLKIPHNLITNSVIETNIRYYSPATSPDDVYTHYSVSASRIIDSYRHLKAGKLQKGDLDPKIFDGMTVLIGGNITGPSADVVKTPMSSRHPGVDIQATMYDNIKNAQFLHDAGFFVNLLTVALLAMFTFICILRFKVLRSLFLVLLVDTIFFVASCVFAYNSYLLSFIGPVSVQLVTLIFGYSFKFITENRNKEKIKQAMGKYLSQDIMKNVVSNIDDLKLGGKRAVVTVLFSDIRGFTSLSEKMSAEEVSMILNEYFAEMEPIITKYNGVINKFIGDAVMAIFGEPIQDINHPKNAVKCAYEMLKKVEYLREKWLYEGKPKIEIGVGINTGEVFIGNIGTENRMEYTVIGDTVNLASRIESYNKVYKTNLLVSSSTYEYIADIADVIKISEVHIRGKAKKMDIYEVLRIDKDR